MNLFRIQTEKKNILLGKDTVCGHLNMSATWLLNMPLFNMLSLCCCNSLHSSGEAFHKMLEPGCRDLLFPSSSTSDWDYARGALSCWNFNHLRFPFIGTKGLKPWQTASDQKYTGVCEQRCPQSFRRTCLDPWPNLMPAEWMCWVCLSHSVQTTTLACTVHS